MKVANPGDASVFYMSKSKENFTETRKVIVLLNALIILSILIKTLFFLKINDSLGLQTALIVTVMKAVIPFLMIFFVWVFFFALESYILGSDLKRAETYGDTSLIFGYIFNTFEFGIGNIRSPSILFWSKPKNDTTALDKTIVTLIYVLWFMNQIYLLIILLNFVIALISQYYESVMNSKV